MTTVQGENVPNKDVVVSRSGERESIRIGPITLEVLEDGSNTDRRIGAVNIIVPPHTDGPPQHWHQMHDETFLVTSGEVTFTSRDKQVVLKSGDYIVVPPMAPHTFGNNGDQTATIYNSLQATRSRRYGSYEANGPSTPAYYVDYFRVMQKMFTDNGSNMTPEIAQRAMMRYATLPTKSMGYDW